MPYAEIERLYDSGFSLSECARISGVAATTIQGYFRRTGKAMRGRGSQHGQQKLSDGAIEETVRLYHDDGLTLDETAERLGINARAVRYRLFLAGRPPRSISEGIKRAYENGKRSGFAGTRGPGGTKK